MPTAPARRVGAVAIEKDSLRAFVCHHAVYAGQEVRANSLKKLSTGGAKMPFLRHDGIPKGACPLWRSPEAEPLGRYGRQPGSKIANRARRGGEARKIQH